LKLFLRFTLFLLLFLTNESLEAQLCQGSLGDPIVKITFGLGANPGAPLAAATTAYQYVSNDCPIDGSYTVRNNTTNCFGNTWHSLTNDHTGDSNGYFLLVNAAPQPNAFYIDTVRGLCGNTTYEFAAWIMNVIKQTACGSNPTQPNITFSIEKTDGTVLQTYNSNNIPTTSTPIWNQFGFFFNTPLGISDIVLRMTNNAFGGCGNDLAMDDITFRACGPLLTPNIIGGLPTTTASICEGTAKTFNFDCSISAGLNNPNYQWQQSFNGIPFTDIIGQNSQSFTKSFLTTASIGTWRYRLSVAEAGNLNSAQCRISSQPITINILPKLVTSVSNNVSVCKNSNVVLTATGGNSYDWNGPNGFIANGNTVSLTNIQPINAGKYYVLIKNGSNCENLDSTIVIINPSPNATTDFSDSAICLGKKITLKANGIGTFQWTPSTFLDNPLSQNPIATPTVETSYQVVVSNQFNCTDTAFTKIKVGIKPEVDAGPDKIIIANKNIQLQGNIIGDIDYFTWTPFEFINNTNIINPTVNPPANKKYYLTATSKIGCGVTTDSVFVKIYQGIFIPNTFTPNGDAKNDTWNIPALEAYPLHELVVFNRFGQIVFQRKQSFRAWDGKHKGETLPNGAYTYMIDLKNGSSLMKGTILLIR
jgi:gliding motility-associated-like protein